MDEKYFNAHKVHVFSLMALVFALISLVLIIMDEKTPYAFIVATAIFIVLYVRARKAKKETE
jgi:L-asparagine transporter-like permease